MEDTMMAKKRFEKTQKVADGNLPDGFRGVVLNFLSIISSCIIPQILTSKCVNLKKIVLGRDGKITYKYDA